ncbi:MAG: hemolysin III family protein [Bacteroidales bacterium]|nr:hemolysin III family protein [Bacteroidales bacterium]
MKKENEPLSAITHALAALLSVAGLILMVVYAARYGQASHIIGFSVFGISLIILYGTSAIYHFFQRETKMKRIFQRIDHAMIFILIAGTYTPISLVMPQRAWGWSIFGIIWGLAVFGVILKLTGIKIREWITVAIYILMGWLALVAISPLRNWLSSEALTWLFMGGVLYTAGCLFFALDNFLPHRRWFNMHDIFHLFVIGGSFCHFWLMFQFII